MEVERIYNLLPLCCFSHEAMSDLIALMSQLVDNKGKILVPGIYDTVAKLTPDEEKLYDAIEFDMVSWIVSILRKS